MHQPPKIDARRIVVFMPNWLGDGVMATPFLRMLRTLYPDAHIAALARPLVAAVVTSGQWSGASGQKDQENTSGFVDEVKLNQKGEEREVVRWLKDQKFELGILLPNSFRSAWMLWRGGVTRRVGYARGGRSCLLTDRLPANKKTPEQKRMDLSREEAIRSISRELGKPRRARVGTAYQPVPTVGYYLEIAKYLMADEEPTRASAPHHMELFVSAAEREEAEGVLTGLGLSGERYAVIVPGANFGSSKCWMPERFAQVADLLIDKRGEFGMDVVLASSPSELPIVEAILAASALCPAGGGVGRLHALAKLNGGKGISIGALKELVRRSSLMICNDTGPRHFAAAFDIPTVTLFGPTDPVWAETYAKREKLVRIDVPCGPCQLKKCPIDHRCMKGLTVDMVMKAVRDVLETSYIKE